MRQSSVVVSAPSYADHFPSKLSWIRKALSGLNDIIGYECASSGRDCEDDDKCTLCKLAQIIRWLREFTNSGEGTLEKNFLLIQDLVFAMKNMNYHYPLDEWGYGMIYDDILRVASSLQASLAKQIEAAKSDVVEVI
jgi:hypothetical protein